ncbi:hypothetical protein WR25_09584 isoform X [Diploscapter pachys]|uniref:GCC2 Rab binding domain-containing protein n=1 Tax=Diploscapter pachys TaxID=2018661 RepID=A0A2A2KXM7_9BILA|nr:hypothetical protein WR25_09584 isoform Q [Diploscapter pachys]PAV78585.1 hypothetical protein WR25_09584 isoform S [Diploscapter pachys]PAV78589.1 hypothetical protein WR25_09584 isoform W [Diploscapter pachys]PAV78590.1 hypothetical protein WR25_09584 isoform X [Diploscapter pachys]
MTDSSAGSSQGTNAGEGQKTQQKSKLDTLPREDLIRLLKKQVEQVKEIKQENAALKDKATSFDVEKGSMASELEDLQQKNRQLSRKIEELEEKQNFFNQVSTSEELMEKATAAELILKAKCEDLEFEVNELKLKMEAQKQQACRDQDEILALKTLRDELRSQLDDARNEASALRENRTAVDVFSLELKDYEIKVDQLGVELKESQAALNTAKSEVQSLELKLEEAKRGEETAQRECHDLRMKMDDIHRELCEEKIKCGELSSSVNELKTKLNSLTEERGSERMGLGRELAQSQQRMITLEEAIEALRDENQRLRSDRDAADAKANDIVKDYEAFKSRARFVLEQKAKSDVEETGNKEELEKLQNDLEEANKLVQSLRFDQTTYQEELKRLREQNVQLEKEARTNRRDADEAQIAMAKSMDEVRNFRAAMEKSSEECAQAKNSKNSLENELIELKIIRDKLEKSLASDRLRFDTELTELKTQLGDEKRRREEAIRQLDDAKKERASRPTPIAAVYPQFTDREPVHSHHTQSRDSPNSPTETQQPRAGSQMSSGKLSQEMTIGESAGGEPDRTLEDVLFGGEISDERILGLDALSPDSQTVGGSVDGLMKEIDRMGKQNEHLRELLSESEASVGRLNDQVKHF